MPTEEQLRKLQKNRRTTRPLYYDSVEGTSLPISTRTEDALILLSTDVKKKAILYIKKMLEAEQSQQSKDYNKLLAEVSQYQIQFGNNVATELEQIIGPFRTFIEGIPESLNEVGDDVQAGMQPIMNAMTRYLGRIIEIDQNERFHSRYSGYMAEQFRRAGTIDSTRELRSWIRVMVSYP